MEREILAHSGIFDVGIYDSHFDFEKAVTKAVTSFCAAKGHRLDRVELSVNSSVQVGSPTEKIQSSSNCDLRVVEESDGKLVATVKLNREHRYF
ncbi:MAG: hypothetical protein HC888_00085 [Candidatus Competibacteraceae bacterium]|nr:hypothetical protein [Candidatus Competibacteraceae bacterium]